LWVWDEEAKEYRTPPQGKTYYAARYETDLAGRRKRVYESFETLDEARAWQNGERRDDELLSSRKVTSGPFFHEIVEEWRRRQYPHIAYSTQLLYDKIVRLYFGNLLPCRIQEITPKRVDAWLDELKAAALKKEKQATRRSFDHELELLSTVLNYYVSYHDDVDFHFPIKRRHREAITLNRPVAVRSKDLSEAEFLRFREELKRLSHGEILSALATVQYYQALRISEAGGVYWEDVRLEWTAPQNSRLKIVRSVCYPHRGGKKAFLKGGFKNAVSNGGVKEQPLFPEAFEALASLYRDGQSGLVFSLGNEPIPYKTIQCRYDLAFKKAGLPYSGTHVMRHGGCRRVFNEVSDIPIAQQLLGNADLKTTLVYAKRHASALTKVAHDYWQKKPGLLATACSPESKS
jgi:integrase